MKGILEMKNYQILIDKLVFFLQEKVKERGFSAVVYGLSGGIDSAVVALLCQKAWGNKAQALLMPSITSSSNSLEDALTLCQKFGIAYQILPLNTPQNAFGEILEGLQENPLRMGNACARMRMICLYDYAFANHCLVIGTSNKSELTLGYGTIFGDMACAINPIGDLYKTEIYEIAKLLGIPQNIIQKPPSADLYEGQSDEEELGYCYEILDKIMILLEQGSSSEEIIKQDLPKDALELVLKRKEQMAFKRKLPEIAILNDLKDRF